MTTMSSRDLNLQDCRTLSKTQIPRHTPADGAAHCHGVLTSLNSAHADSRGRPRPDNNTSGTHSSTAHAIILRQDPCHVPAHSGRPGGGSAGAPSSPEQRWAPAAAAPPHPPSTRPTASPPRPPALAMSMSVSFCATSAHVETVHGYEVSCPKPCWPLSAMLKLCPYSAVHMPGPTLTSQLSDNGPRWAAPQLALDWHKCLASVA